MINQSILLATRTKSWYCGRSVAEIMGLHSRRAMDVCLLRICMLSGIGLCDRLFYRQKECYRVWCVTECHQMQILHLQPRTNWPTWASIFLITHPILRIWPRQTTTCLLDWKNNWKVADFHPKRRSLLPRRPAWTENILIFFFILMVYKS